MSNYKIIFIGTERSETNEHELEAFATNNDEIYVCIDMGVEQYSYLCLDKSTAIKFAKTLRTEINKIQ
jgi:hypothetical protein